MRICFCQMLEQQKFVRLTRKVVRRTVRIWLVQKISSGSIEWSCAADVTTIPQCHEKTLTQIEACYVESIVKADELFANWVQEHLERLWCSSEGIRCSITISFVSNRKNEFVRSLKYCYIIYQFSVLTPKYSISEVNKIQRIRERKTKTYYQL